jgi:hypothetical protein
MVPKISVSVPNPDLFGRIRSRMFGSGSEATKITILLTLKLTLLLKFVQILHWLGSGSGPSQFEKSDPYPDNKCPDPQHYINLPHNIVRLSL